MTVLSVIFIPKVLDSLEYNEAIQHMGNKEYEIAEEMFIGLEDYKDSVERANRCFYLRCEEQYEKALEMKSKKEYDEAIRILEQDLLSDLEGEEGVKLSNDIENLIWECNENKVWLEFISEEYKEVSLGDHHIVGLKPDGTVVAVGDNSYGQCNVSDWVNITSVSAGRYATLGLQGQTGIAHVKFAGEEPIGDYKVSDWDLMCSIDGGCNSAHVGLNLYGRVKAVGGVFYAYGCEESMTWRDITEVVAGNNAIYGLKSDGTVLVAGDHSVRVENDAVVLHYMEGWSDIVAIAAGWDHVVGLKSDGTVVVSGPAYGYASAVQSWTDIVAIKAGFRTTIGLKSDGTVVAVGENTYGECNVEDWTDIVAIEAGRHNTIGIKSDGTIVATGIRFD